MMRPAFGNVSSNAPPGAHVAQMDQRVYDYLTGRGYAIIRWNAAPGASRACGCLPAERAGDTTRNRTDAERRRRIRDFAAQYPSPQISLLHESEPETMLPGGLLEYSLQQYSKAGYRFVTVRARAPASSDLAR